MTSRRKQEENHLKILKDLLTQPANKKCLECDQRGPTYVDVTIGSFVCTSCGGILRGLNPPHRVKSISMTTFTAAEISFIESRGNEWCRAVYLAKYDEQSRAKPESRSDHSKLKYFMELKYEQKRWYESPSQQRKLMENAAAVKKTKDSSSPPIKPLQSLLGKNVSGVQIPTAKQAISHEIKARRDVKPSADLLGSLTSTANPSTTARNQAFPTNASGSSDAFADFDSVFGGFSAPPASTSQNAFGAFGQIGTEPISFTNDVSQSSVQGKKEPAGNSGMDKYAALADLDLVFHRTELPPQPVTEKMNDFSWSSPARPAQQNLVMLQTSQPDPSVPMQQNFLFSSVPANNANSALSSWSSTPATWNSGFQDQTTAQQMNVQAANPFFSLAPATNPQPGSAQSEFGAWTQPQQQISSQQQIPSQMNNPAAFSSTNPFNMGANANQHSYFQQTQNVKPISNTGNPFMF